MIRYQENGAAHAAPALHPMPESARVFAVQSAAAHVLTFILGLPALVALGASGMPASW